MQEVGKRYYRISLEVVSRTMALYNTLDSSITDLIQEIHVIMFVLIVVKRDMHVEYVCCFLEDQIGNKFQ